MKKAEQHPCHADIVAYALNAIDARDCRDGTHWDEQQKAEFIQRCLNDIDTYVLSQEDPLTACRLRAMDLMQIAARFCVLIMKKPMPAPYVSGQLTSFVADLAALDPQLGRFFGSLDPAPASTEEMRQALAARHGVLNLLVSVYNMVRSHLGDGNDDSSEDWFHACYHSLCIWQEDHYRRLLGMPTLIEGVMADLKVEMFLSWPDKALERDASPRRAWEAAWQTSFHEPSPFADA